MERGSSTKTIFLIQIHFSVDAAVLAITQGLQKLFWFNFKSLSFLKNIPSKRADPELTQDYKRTGDLNVLGELYQRYMDLVYGVCLKYLKEPEDAKDCVLSIFEELVTKLLKHDVLEFKSWLYQLAKNHCLMRLRSSKKLRPVSLDVNSMQLEDNVHLNGVMEKEEHLEQLEICLGQLAGEQRAVVELFYKQSKCYNEIAESTGLEWNKVRSMIQNGRRNLKICMEKERLKSTF
jgi:RNA polymerase sigma-70 factor (ECF subfamily)